MTIKQSRYITAETEAQKKVRVTEVQKIEEDPYIRRSEVQQEINNSTLPVSSRAVKLAIESIKPPSLEGYARKEYVDDAIDDVNYSISNIESDVSAINSGLDKKVDKSDLEGLATERYVDEKIDSIPEVDLTPYATREELEEKADISYVDDKIADIEIPSIEGLATEEYVDNKVESIDLSGYATEQYVDSEIGKIYIPSLEGYATEEYVDNKVSSIDLSEYALTSDLSSAIESINSDLDLKADKIELEGLATEDYVNEKIDEKEIGITEPELISKSVGSGEWIRQTELDKKWDVQNTVGSSIGKVMREGAYGLGSISSHVVYNLSLDYDIESSETLKNGFYRVAGGSTGFPEYKNSGDSLIKNGWGGTYWSVLHLSTQNRLSMYSRKNGISQGWVEFYSTGNTSTDRNGVLHAGTKTPIDTLNVSDMVDTVVDNDLLTVTSGAVYRAIAELQNKTDLEGLATREWVNERLSEFMNEVKEEIRKAQGVRFKDGGI